MNKVLSAFTLLFGFYFCNMSFAQNTSAFSELNFPHSIKSFGMGFQGVASLNSTEAMQYNPAGLVFSDSISASYFRDPFNMMGFGGLPITSADISVRVGKSGYLGLEYHNVGYGSLKQHDPDGVVGDEPYLRSFALAYANRINSEFSVGAELRVGWANIANVICKNGKLMISAGAFYQPEKLQKRLSLGLSLLNYSKDLNVSDGGVSYSYPMPSSLNFGINSLPVKNKYFNLDFELSTSLPLEKGSLGIGDPMQYEYKAVYNKWEVLPNDVKQDLTTSIGLAYIFHPIYLGNDISFIQEMYLGYVTAGAPWYNMNIFTHGFKVGVEVKGVTATAGYAGRWHSNNKLYEIQFFPWENFEFSLSSNLDFYGKKQTDIATNTAPRNIILSAGYTFGKVFGKMNNWQNKKYGNNNNWQLSADFYLDENSAIVTSFEYGTINEKIDHIMRSAGGSIVGYTDDFDNTTVSLESGFRYHPLKSFHPLFVQASVGVIRINPILNSFLKYYYKPYDRIIAGCVIPFENEKIIITPKIALRTIFMEDGSRGTKMLGYNQFEAGVNLGYRF